jgi:chromosome partitioning protein
MGTVASYHHKGGVGKTTTAVALAAHAARAGHRTLLWDLDPQGAATRLVVADRGLDGGIERIVLDGGSLADRAVRTSQDGLVVVPADPSLRGLDRHVSTDAGGEDRLRAAIAAVRDRFDLVVLDCPPSVSATAAAVLRAADLVLVPLTVGPLAWSAYADLHAEVDAMTDDHRPEILAFLTMVDRRKRLHRELADEEETPEGFSPVTIPTDSRVERMALEPAPVRAVLTGRAGRAYAALWDHVAEILPPGGPRQGRAVPTRAPR